MMQQMILNESCLCSQILNETLSGTKFTVIALNIGYSGINFEKLLNQDLAYIDVSYVCIKYAVVMTKKKLR